MTKSAIGLYRKIQVRTWGDEKFCALSQIPPCGQGLWFYLLTGPHTGSIPGIFRASRLAMAEELGWTVEAFDEAFAELSAQGLAQANFAARMIFIPKACKHNPPGSPNVVKSWGKQLDAMPECALKLEAYEGLKSFICNMGEAFAKAFDEAFVKPSTDPSAKGSSKASLKAWGNQKQYQKQYQEQNLVSNQGEESLQDRVVLHPRARDQT